MYIIHLYRKLRMSFVMYVDVLIECFSFPQYVNMLSEHLLKFLFKKFSENSLISLSLSLSPRYFYSKLQIKKYFKDFCAIF